MPGDTIFDKKKKKWMIVFMGVSSERSNNLLGGNGFSVDLSGSDFLSDLGNGLMDLVTGGYYGANKANRVNADIAQQNLDLQTEAFNYTKWLNEQSWLRDDTAIQRRVADLKAAGLNPLLAVGSAASNTSPLSVSAPQNKFDYKAPYKGRSVPELVQLGLQMSQEFAGIENINVRNDYTRAITDNVILQNDNINAQVAKKYMDLWNETYDLYVKGNVTGNDLISIARGIAGKFGLRLDLQKYASGNFYELNSKMIEAIWSKYGSPLLGDSGLDGLKMGSPVDLVNEIVRKRDIAPQLPYESGKDYLLRRILQ